MARINFTLIMCAGLFASIQPSHADDLIDQGSLGTPNFQWMESESFRWSQNPKVRKSKVRREAFRENQSPITKSEHSSVGERIASHPAIYSENYDTNFLTTDPALFMESASPERRLAETEKTLSLLNTQTEPSYQTKIQQETIVQRAIAYVGLAATGMFYDLDYGLDFGNSQDWTTARGTTVAASQVCSDGGGYDIFVTRDDFTTLSGVINAESCEFGGISISGSATFKYEDKLYYQDIPLQLHPLEFNFSNVSITDQAGRVFRYTGKTSCDWRLNQASDSWVVDVHDQAFGKYAFGEEHDGASMIVVFRGSLLDSLTDDSTVTANNLRTDSAGRTGVYALTYDNCDISNTYVSYSGQIFTITASKYISSPNDDHGYAIFSVTRELSKSMDFSAPAGKDAVI